MKRRVLWITAVGLIVVSILVAGYPLISNYVNSLFVQDETVAYGKALEALSQKDYEDVLNKAYEYNKKLAGSTYIADPFAETESTENKDYENMLKIKTSEVMATINIPKIKINLPIYHGTSDEVLKKGIGHLSSSSLPVGGVGTHAVLTGHTASSDLKLFSDLNQLEVGDVFYVTCLKERMAYLVDQIKVVLPSETDDLQIDAEEDFVTLVTCTPFGINTHRLLVRGRRITLNEADEIVSAKAEADSTWKKEYLKALAFGFAVLVLILLVYFSARFIIKKLRASKRNSGR